MNRDDPPPDPSAIAAYVTAAAPLLGLELDAERKAAVTAAFTLICRVAAPALAFPLDRLAEPAPVFVPVVAAEKRS